MRPQRNMEGPGCQQNDFLLKQLRKDSISFASENFNPNGFNKSIDSKETILSCNMIFSLQFSLSEYRERISNQTLAVVFSKSKSYFLPQDSYHLLDWHNQLIKTPRLFRFFLYFRIPKVDFYFHSSLYTTCLHNINYFNRYNSLQTQRKCKVQVIGQFLSNPLS